MGEEPDRQAATTTDKFDIVDTQGNKYYPIQLDTADEPVRVDVADAARRCRPSLRPDTTAYFGPTQGGLLLFKINTPATRTGR